MPSTISIAKQGAPDWRICPGFGARIPQSPDRNWAEHAIVGRFEAIAYDLVDCEPRIIGWELFTGPKLTTQIAKGCSETFEAAKEAAEAALRQATAEA